MPDIWSQEEVEVAVADYLKMLEKELRGEPFNKAERNRNLQTLLNHRSRAAIEKKHQNISAVLIDLGYPYVDGYKPLRNYQELLYSVVERQLFGATDLEAAITEIVEQMVTAPLTLKGVAPIWVEPPSRGQGAPKAFDKPPQDIGRVKRNYLEIESRNHSLGLAGENMVLEFEHKRLWQAGRKDLAKRIEHVAQTTGDHLGFDIQSFETDGRNRLIEVKTTRFGALTPFFASRKEVAVSAEREVEYQLYRLFKFTEQPGLFVLPGSLTRTCSLDPVVFSAVPI